MTLTTPPTRRILPDPGVPFVVYACWGDGSRIAIANVPGGPLGEFAIGGRLAQLMGQVAPSELPIVLTLRLEVVGQGSERRGEWTFDYLGGPEYFDSHGAAADIRSTVAPRSASELNEAEREMLRDSLGVGPEDDLPEPAGPLPEGEQAEQPYRFDPTPHLDLSTAEAPPELPQPAQPGPEPAPNAQTAPVPHIPPPAKPLGAFGDASVPFRH